MNQRPRPRREPGTSWSHLPVPAIAELPSRVQDWALDLLGWMVDLEGVSAAPTPEEVGATLRRRAFETQLETGRPRSVGGTPGSFGLIHEFWQGGVLVTLAAFSTGDLSLYFSNGGGILGGIEHENVAQLVRKTIPLLGPLTAKLERSDDIAPPAPGEVTFTILTDQGRFRGRLTGMPEARKDNVDFQLFALSQGLVTELRKANETART